MAPHSRDSGLRPFSIGMRLGQGCSVCGEALFAEKIHTPGHRTVIATQCSSCGKDYLVDAPTGFGLVSPEIFDPAENRFRNEPAFPFWRMWAEKFYRERSDVALSIDIKTTRKIKRPLILNCLDPLYGHVLKVLFHATSYMERFPEYDLVVIIPKSFSWMLPGELAGAMLVEWPSSLHYSWSKALDNAVAALARDGASISHCQTIHGLSCAEFDISSYSRVTPFNRDNWQVRDGVSICYIWRDNRFWGGSAAAQIDKIEKVHKGLACVLPGLRLTVAGVSSDRHEFSPGIENEILTAPDAAGERRLVELYANAHLVMGVHGSNMILPSAHAGATLELVPPKRWHNAWTASQFRQVQDSASATFFHRFLPLNAAISDIVDIIRATILFAPRFVAIGAGMNTRFDAVDDLRIPSKAKDFPPLPL